LVKSLSGFLLFFPGHREVCATRRGRRRQALVAIQLDGFVAALLAMTSSGSSIF
jgi:hypothetical protein